MKLLEGAKVNLAATQFNLQHNALELYVSGCTIHCYDCHNPDLWDFSLGEQPDINKILTKIDSAPGLIKKVWILGGEPLDQDLSQLASLIKVIRSRPVEIWLWTSYELDSVPLEIIQLIDFVKCGKYEDTLKTAENITFNISLASSNQYIVDLRSTNADRNNQ